MSLWGDFRIAMTWGDTRKFRWNVLVAGVAQNITGWTFQFTVKDELTDLDAAAVFQKTSSSGIAVISVSTGVIEVVPCPKRQHGREALLSDRLKAIQRLFTSAAYGPTE